MLLLPQYYDLTALSVRTAAWHLMTAGINRFKASLLGGGGGAHLSTGGAACQAVQQYL